MAKNYSYPRVDINTNLVKRSHTKAELEDRTIMFVPFVSKKGPQGEPLLITSLSEFVYTYGELDYNIQGQTALNIANWLSEGGYIYAYRLTLTNDRTTKYGTTTIIHQEDNLETPENEESDVTSYTERFESKYKGYYYKNLAVRYIAAKGSSYCTIIIYECKYKNGNIVGRTQIDKYSYIKIEKLKSWLETNSEYINLIGDVESNSSEAKDELYYYIPDPLDNDTTKAQKDVEDSANWTINNFDDALKSFWDLSAETSEYTPECKAIANKSLYPIDIILDAGYSKDVKEKIYKFIDSNELTSDEGIRQDIIFIADTFSTTQHGGKVTLTQDNDSEVLLSKTDNHLTIYRQSYTIDNDGVITPVTATYFISKLMPYNDRVYGIQWPLAGTNRAVLEGVISISENPDPETKESWFAARVNYAEKTSREVAFMSQRTHDGSSDDSYTALSFLNNARVTEKIKKELEKIGRSYLFEFNDSATLASMEAAMNKYITSWITNRTLSLGEVTVAASGTNAEAVDVNILIRFTNTIEVITIDLTIE